MADAMARRWTTVGISWGSMRIGNRPKQSERCCWRVAGSEAGAVDHENAIVFHPRQRGALATTVPAPPPLEKLVRPAFAAGMECRSQCGACCIALSISSPIPGMPRGKPAGTPCVQLLPGFRCALFGRTERPAVCASLRPDPAMCGRSREEAMFFLTRLEAATSSPDVAGAERGGASRDGAEGGPSQRCFSQQLAVSSPEPPAPTGQKTPA